MNPIILYCKKCGNDEPHIKAGFAGGKQLYQCKMCDTRRIEQQPRKNTRMNDRVAFRLSKDYLDKLDSLPGKNRTAKFLFVLDKYCQREG